MIIGPCIIVIVEEWKTNLMSIAILFHFFSHKKWNKIASDIKLVFHSSTISLPTSVRVPNLKIHHMAKCSITAIRKPSDFQGDTRWLLSSYPTSTEQSMKCTVSKSALLHVRILAYYAWPRIYPSRSCKRNPWRQHVHRATRRRSQAIDMAWRHVALATTTISA